MRFPRSSLTRLLTGACLFAAALSPAAQAAGPAGLASIDKTAIATPAMTEKSMEQFARLGLRNVSVDAWLDGYTQFPSAVMKKAAGAERHPALVMEKDKRDLVEETRLQAARQGLVYIAWFGAGLPDAASAPTHPLRVAHPDWLARDAEGKELTADGSAWLNPLLPEVRAFLLALMQEAVNRYELDGIRLDDSLLLPPVALVRDAQARALYTSETGRAAPAEESDADWQAWRRAKAAAQAQFLRGALLAQYPRLYVGAQADAEPDLPQNWRPRATALYPSPSPRGPTMDSRWRVDGLARGRYHVIGFDGYGWEVIRDIDQMHAASFDTRNYFFVSFRYSRVELIVDRSRDLRRAVK